MQMLKHYKRVLKGASGKHRKESPSHSIEPADELVTKSNEEQHLSPRIAASPVLAPPETPSQAVPATSSSPYSAQASLPSPASSAASPAPSKFTPNGPVIQDPLNAPLAQPASPVHVEESGVSHTSSAGSNSKPKGHKAALHAANGRLQKALQNQAKSAISPAAAATAQAHTPISTASSPGSTVPSPLSLEVSLAKEAPGPQHKQQLKAGGSENAPRERVSHVLSDTSVLSAESDDDAEDLAGAAFHVLLLTRHTCTRSQPAIATS